MNVKSSDIYLNTLCLTAYAPGEKSAELARAVVRMFDEISDDERILMKPINILYVNLLRDVSKGQLNLSNRAEVSDTLLKYEDDPAFKSMKFQFDELKNLLTPSEPVSDRRIETLFNRVRRNITWMRGERRLRKLMIDLHKGENESDDEKADILLEKILGDADKLRSELKADDLKEGEAAPIDEIDFTDPKSIMKGLTAQQKKSSGSVIKFGWQALNRMFGPKQGASYGETFAVAARSHNYKSGLLCDIARWICTLNTPPDTNGATPIVLFISLENDVQENLMDWYKKLYVNAFMKDPGDLTKEEIVQYISDRFNEKGFRFVAKRRMGDTFGYHEYEGMVNEMEKLNGAKVVATILDYITLCHRCPEDSAHNDAVQLQMMAKRFYNHSNHNSVFFATGLQLETKASEIAATGKHNIVKQYNEFHLADCKGLKREFDVLFFMEIEKNHHDLPYLTMAWQKHRYVNDTPAEWKYFGMRFDPAFGLLDDLGKEDRSVQDIFADESTESEGDNSTHVVDIL